MKPEREEDQPVDPVQRASSGHDTGWLAYDGRPMGVDPAGHGRLQDAGCGRHPPEPPGRRRTVAAGRPSLTGPARGATIVLVTRPVDDPRADGRRPAADAQRPAPRPARRSTARGGSSSCAQPDDDARRRTGREADVPGCWTMQGTSRPAALHQRPDAVPGPAAGDPRARTRPASTSATFEVPGGWAGRRVVLHVGAAESVLIVAPQRRRDRHRQGLPPRRRSST